MDLTFFYNTGNLRNFEMEESGDSGLIKRALVATEGTFKDSKGNPHTFTTERLKTICDFTNQRLSSGNTIPVCTDHKKTVENTVGEVAGNAEVRPITEFDLPNPKATHLLGKMGLFFNDVSIKVADVAEKVKNKVITGVSMGLNLDPQNQSIMELSLVPIPAIPNMGLFGVMGNDEDNAFTWEDLETNTQTLDDLKEEYTKLTDQLWTLLNNIYTSENIDIPDISILQQYVYTALNGFSIRVVDILGLTNETGAAGNATPDQQAAQANATRYEDIVSSAQTAPTAKYSKKLHIAKFSRAPKYVRGDKGRYKRGVC